MGALKSDGIMLKSSRNEIVDSLATHIMLYTHSPTAKELELVALRFIKTHPSAADMVKGATAHVSLEVKCTILSD